VNTLASLSLSPRRPRSLSAMAPRAWVPSTI
jgi:hypothetical protein